MPGRVPREDENREYTAGRAGPLPLVFSVAAHRPQR